MWFRFKPFDTRASIGCVLFNNEIFFRVLDVGAYLNYAQPGGYFKKHHGSKTRLATILPEIFWSNFPKWDTVYDGKQVVAVLTKKQSKVKERVDEFLEMWYHGILAGGETVPSPYKCHLRYDTAPVVCVRRRLHDEEGVLFQDWLREYKNTVSQYLSPLLSKTLARNLDLNPPSCASTAPTSPPQLDGSPLSYVANSVESCVVVDDPEDFLPQLQQTDDAKNEDEESQVIIKLTFNKKDIFCKVESEEKKIVLSTLPGDEESDRVVGNKMMRKSQGNLQRMMTIQAFRIR